MWVEELRTYMESNLYTINKRQEKMYDENNCYYWLDDLTEVDENKDAEFYEWIEDSDLIQTIPLQVSTSIFCQMEFDRWSVRVKMLEEIIDMERWL